MSSDSKLAVIHAAAADAASPALRPPVPPASLAHRELLGGEFWRRIPAYADVTRRSSSTTTGRRRTRSRTSASSSPRCRAWCPRRSSRTRAEGFERAPMTVRVSPYLLSLIDWSDPDDDPLRTQFIPLASRLLPDHPKLDLDSLHERADAPVPGLTHRYPDKALFLALDTCPVYCRFCTRSYAVGVDTDEVEKVQLKVNEERWQRAFDYIALAARARGHRHLRRRRLPAPRRADHADRRDAARRSPNIRRIRFATKGPAVMPQKLLTDDAWIDALTARRRARAASCTRRSCCTPTSTTRTRSPRSRSAAMNRLFERGIIVRNQSRAAARRQRHRSRR